MKKGKSRKPKVFIFTIIVILFLIVFSYSPVVIAHDNLWYLQGDTVVLKETDHNVSIGKNISTDKKLLVTGDLYVKGCLDVTEDTTLSKIVFDGATDDFIIDTNSKNLTIFTGQTDESLNITVEGIITLPYQSSARVRLSSSQSVNANIWTKLLLTNEDYDLNNDFSAYKFTVPFDGVYSVAYSVSISDIERGYFVSSVIYKNGIAKGGYENNYAPVLTDLYQSGADILYLEQDDYLELWVYHNHFLTSKIFTLETYTNYMAVCKIA